MSLMIINPKGKRKVRKAKKTRKVRKIQILPSSRPSLPIHRFSPPIERPFFRKRRKVMRKRKKISRRSRASSTRHKLVVYGKRGHIRVSRKSKLAPRSRGILLNPRGKLLGTDFSAMDILTLAGGGIAVRILPNYIPIPQQFKEGYQRLIVQGAIAIALGMLVSKVLKQKRIGDNLMIGGLIATASNLIDAVALKGQIATGDLSVYLPPSSIVSNYMPSPTTSSNVSYLETSDEENEEAY